MGRRSRELAVRREQASPLTAEDRRQARELVMRRVEQRAREMMEMPVTHLMTNMTTLLYVTHPDYAPQQTQCGEHASQRQLVQAAHMDVSAEVQRTATVREALDPWQFCLSRMLPRFEAAFGGRLDDEQLGDAAVQAAAAHGGWAQAAAMMAAGEDGQHVDAALWTRVRANARRVKAAAAAAAAPE